MADNAYNITLLTDAQLTQMKKDTKVCIDMTRQCQEAPTPTTCDDASSFCYEKQSDVFALSKRNPYDIRQTCDTVTVGFCGDSQHALDMVNNTYNVTLLNVTELAAVQAAVPECTSLVEDCQDNALACVEALEFCQSRIINVVAASSQRNPYDIRMACNEADAMNCYDLRNLTSFLNSARVRAWLNVSEQPAKAWAPCSAAVGGGFAFDVMRGFEQRVAELLDSGARMMRVAGAARKTERSPLIPEYGSDGTARPAPRGQRSRGALLAVSALALLLTLGVVTWESGGPRLPATYQHSVDMAFNDYNVSLLDAAQVAAMRAAQPVCRELTLACQSNATACLEALDFCSSALEAPYFLAKRNPYDIREPCDEENVMQCFHFEHVDAFLNSAKVLAALGVDTAHAKPWRECDGAVGAGFAADQMVSFAADVALALEAGYCAREQDPPGRLA
ncbi:hypothetical protein PybrP1_001698 [[Pythium] brassicae (nom. inval.)]|nr:hypothetical protein PybrP1_001698 [[Pythium] brassicae (nom. inval.)]